VDCQPTGERRAALQARRAELKAEKDKNEEEMKEFGKTQTSMQADIANMEKEKKGLGDLKKRKKTLEMQIIETDKQIDVLKSQVDVTRLIDKADTDIRRLQKRQVPLILAQVNAVKEEYVHQTTKMMAEIDLKQASNEMQGMKLVVQTAQRARKEVQDRKQEGLQRVHRLHDDAKNLTKEAKLNRSETQQKLLDGSSSNLRDLDAAIEEALTRVEEPRDLDEIENYIQKVNVKADIVFVHNPNAIKMYEERKAKMLTIRVELETKQAELTTKSASLQQRQEQWKAELIPIVESISIIFAKHMKSLEFEGAVLLEEHPTDFSKWCIDIKVKYRKQAVLQSLDGSAQSGGEKTMATIIYLTALQEQATCPFRVVDEINQGVDENNEKKIFKVVSHSACEPKNPQMFMMCQKVVSGLEYHPGMTILNIFNGPHNCTSEELCASRQAKIAAVV